MANKKVSELPKASNVLDDDIFVLDQLGGTKTAYLSTIATKISGGSIPKPTGLAAGNNGNVLTYQHSTTSWIASAANFIPKPTGLTIADDGKVLTYQQSSTSWVASAVNISGNFITKPTTNVATDVNKVLTLNSSNAWVASDAPNPYDTVGNAAAGIFVSAVLFDSGTSGNWTVPAGVTSIRVTAVGGCTFVGGGGWCTVTFEVNAGTTFPYSVGVNVQFSNQQANKFLADTRFNYRTGNGTPGVNAIHCYNENAHYDAGHVAWNGFVGFKGGNNNTSLQIDKAGKGGYGANGYGGGGGCSTDLVASYDGGSWGLPPYKISGGVSGGAASGGVNGDGGYSMRFGSYLTPNGLPCGGGRVPLSYAALKLLTTPNKKYGMNNIGGVIIIEW